MSLENTTNTENVEVPDVTGNAIPNIFYSAADARNSYSRGKGWYMG